MSEVERGDEHQVTPLELFFDLVFVFAITQVTSLLADDPTWGGVLRGTLVLGALWWAWSVYAWLTSAIDVDEGGVRLTVLAAMGAMFSHRRRRGLRARSGRDRGGRARNRRRLRALVALLRRRRDLRPQASDPGERPRAATPRAALLELPPPADGRRRRALRTVPAVALCGGAALYLLGHIAFLFRTTGRLFRRRTVGAAALLALVPAAVAIPALAALALVGAVCSFVVAYEVLRYRAARVRIRHPELAD